MIDTFAMAFDRMPIHDPLPESAFHGDVVKGPGGVMYVRVGDQWMSAEDAEPIWLVEDAPDDP